MAAGAYSSKTATSPNSNAANLGYSPPDLVGGYEDDPVDGYEDDLVGGSPPVQLTVSDKPNIRLALKAWWDGNRGTVDETQAWGDLPISLKV